MKDRKLSPLQSMPVDELLETFDLLEGWDEKCDYLLELGERVPRMPEELQTDENYVHGCQSRVWLTARMTDETPPCIEFVADSDALIVRGVIYVLMVIYSGKTPQEVLETDVQGILQQIGLERMLGIRKNGLKEMLKRIRGIAVEAMQAS